MAVKATRVDSITEALGTPGAYQLLPDEQGVRAVTYVCPCGCGGAGVIEFRGPEAVTWNQNRAAPTIAGEIKRPCGCNWTLTSGNWERQEHS